MLDGGYKVFKGVVIASRVLCGAAISRVGLPTWLQKYRYDAHLQPNDRWKPHVGDCFVAPLLAMTA